jgi:branched-chain amino acid transport system substrate-binding protein
MNKKLIYGLIMAVIVIILVVIGFREGNQQVNFNKNTIKVGALLPLTGKIASFGEDVKNGLEIAKKELKIEGLNIEIVYEDSAGDPKIALPASQKLITIDMVDVVVGGPGSTANLAVVPVFNEEQIPFVVLSSSGNLIDAGKYIFKFIPDIRDEVNYIVELFNQQNVNSVAILFDQSSDSNTLAKDTFISKFNSRILDEGFDSKTTNDFRSILTKVKDFDPEVIYIIANDRSAAPLVSQARDLGLTQEIYGWSGMETQNFIDTAGQSSEGVILTGLPYSCSSNPSQEKFCDTYKMMFDGREPGYYGATAYSLLKIISESVDSANISHDLVDRLTDNVYKELIGEFGMDEKGNISGINFVLRKVENGEFVEIDYVY